jgi:hypothetical protein
LCITFLPGTHSFKPFSVLFIGEEIISTSRIAILAFSAIFPTIPTQFDLTIGP